jgi:hypothetical protein
MGEYRHPYNRDKDYFQDMNIGEKKHDERMKQPWEDHPVISPASVPNGTKGVFSAELIHNGPSNNEGVRCFLFQQASHSLQYHSQYDQDSLIYEFVYAQQLHDREKTPHTALLLLQSWARHSSILHEFAPALKHQARTILRQYDSQFPDLVAEVRTAFKL